MSILYASVPRGHEYLEEGHWFFDEEQWVICASVGKDFDGKWNVHISAERSKKPITQASLQFSSLNEAKRFVADYFERPVVDCAPDDFPSAESL